MRIISGEFRGRNLKVLKGDNTRPTTDRVKESLMSTIFSARGFEGACVLDAFAGSGQLGLEALSRGATEAWFCEKSRDAARIVQENMALCKVGRDRGHLISADSMKLPSRAALPAFDIVFLDPPYAFAAHDVFEWIRAMDQAGFIAPGALVSYEYAKRDKAEVEAEVDALEWAAVSVRAYGDTVVTILRKE